MAPSALRAGQAPTTGPLQRVRPPPTAGPALRVAPSAAAGQLLQGGPALQAGRGPGPGLQIPDRPGSSGRSPPHPERSDAGAARRLARVPPLLPLPPAGRAQPGQRRARSRRPAPPGRRSGWGTRGMGRPRCWAGWHGTPTRQPRSLGTRGARCRRPSCSRRRRCPLAPPAAASWAAAPTARTGPGRRTPGRVARRRRAATGCRRRLCTLLPPPPPAGPRHKVISNIPTGGAGLSRRPRAKWRPAAKGQDTYQLRAPLELAAARAQAQDARPEGLVRHRSRQQLNPSFGREELKAEVADALAGPTREWNAPNGRASFRRSAPLQP